MSFTKYVTVECDNCGSESEATTSTTVKEAREDVVKEGWAIELFGRKKIDICPDCKLDSMRTKK